jgi:hypothetical protein
VFASHAHKPLASGFDLTPQWIAAGIVASVLVGLAVTVQPVPVLAAVALPILLALVVSRPEWILILFLTAGIYKQDPRITSVLPIDVTIVMGSVLVLTILVEAVRRPLRIPGQIWLLAPLVVMVAQGIIGRAPEYGHEKALRFCTLTMLGVLGGCVLLTETERLKRFLLAIAAVGFLLSVDATHQPETTTEGRLTAHGSNPIALARVGALTLAFAWIRFHFARKPFDKVLYIVILAVASVCVLGAGSRGPVLSIVLGMGLISFVTTAHHGRSPVGITTMLLVGGLAALVISFSVIPSLPLYRFKLLFSEDKGTSIFLRGLLMATAFKLMLTHPFGLGVGASRATPFSISSTRTTSSSKWAARRAGFRSSVSCCSSAGASSASSTSCARSTLGAFCSSRSPSWHRE